jgi:hypothetical protein
VKKVYWTPWIEQTKDVINKGARYLFAALVLSLLILANIAAICVILVHLKSFGQ